MITLMALIVLLLPLSVLLGVQMRAWRAQTLLRACHLAEAGRLRQGDVALRGQLIALSSLPGDVRKGPWLRLILAQERGSLLDGCRAEELEPSEGVAPPANQQELLLQGWPMECVAGLGKSGWSAAELEGEQLEVIVSGQLSGRSVSAPRGYRESCWQGVIGTADRPPVIALVRVLRRRVVWGLAAALAFLVIALLGCKLGVRLEVALTAKGVDFEPPRPQIAAAESRTCAIRGGGRVFCWDTSIHDEKQIEAAMPIPHLENVRAITAGWSHFCALKKNGRVACWGRNRRGQLGSPKEESQYVDEVPTIKEAIQVVALGSSTCALSRDGNIWCWGQLREGLGCRTVVEPALGISHPAQIALTDAEQIFRSHPLMCARRRFGDVWCWGEENPKATGFDQLAVHQQPALRGVRAFKNVAGALVSISAKGQIAVHLHPRDGVVPRGRLEWDGLVAREVASFADNLCVLTNDHALRCWKRLATPLGSGEWRLGASVNTSHHGVAEVAVGYEHACVLYHSGKIACWDG